jgi:UDP-glucose 4-epimerase
MKIIVTGGAGFVGSHLVKLLIEKKYFPIIVDNLSSGKYGYIKKFVDDKKASFLKIDIRNYEKLQTIPKADAVIHLAAIPSVVEAVKNPIHVNLVNINGTLNMLELCRTKQIPKFIFTSSSAIYGNGKNISEKTESNPISTYGFTKLIGEMLCKSYASTKLKITILRPFNVYGPRQNEEHAGVIYKFINTLKQNKRPTIFGNGNQTRDFIHINDVITIYEKVLKIKNKKTIADYNIATGTSTSINQLLKICLDVTNKKEKAIFKKGILEITQNNQIDIRKLKRDFKIKSNIKLHEGIKEMIENNSQ